MVLIHSNLSNQMMLITTLSNERVKKIMLSKIIYSEKTIFTIFNYHW